MQEIYYNQDQKNFDYSFENNVKQFSKEDYEHGAGKMQNRIHTYVKKKFTVYEKLVCCFGVLALLVLISIIVSALANLAILQYITVALSLIALIFGFVLLGKVVAQEIRAFLKI